jgi:hypothetical protein
MDMWLSSRGPHVLGKLFSSGISVVNFFFMDFIIRVEVLAQETLTEARSVAPEGHLETRRPSVYFRSY